MKSSSAPLLKRRSLQKTQRNSPSAQPSVTSTPPSRSSSFALAIDLPDELYETFAKDELIGLSGAIVAERPTGFTVRLNIKHGPNTEQLIQAHDLRNSEFGLEFDPEHLKINVNRVEKIWLDLVFETPNFNRISLIDLAFSKRPRVEI